MTDIEDTTAEIPETPTDPGAPVEAADSPAELPEAVTPDEDTPEESDDDQGEETGSKEAARYRRKLRDTEAERDALAARLDTLQRAEAERLAAAELIKPVALWAGGAELADLLDADGNVDPEKVKACAYAVRVDLGIAAPQRKHIVPREGENPGPGRTGGSMLDTIMGRQS